MVNNWGKCPRGWGFSLSLLARGWGFLNSFLPGGWGIRPSRNCPGGGDGQSWNWLIHYKWVVQQSVFQLQRPASDWDKLCHFLMQWYPKGNSSIMNSQPHIFSPPPSIPSIALIFTMGVHWIICCYEEMFTEYKSKWSHIVYFQTKDVLSKIIH